MGENDATYENDCANQSTRKDCDGDFDTYCNYSGTCQYQKNTRDCDGDVISLCRK